MPLLQLHMAGQEPEERVQAGTRAASPWPAETGGVMSESLILLLSKPPSRWAAERAQGQSVEEAHSQELPRAARTREHTECLGSLRLHRQSCWLSKLIQDQLENSVLEF